MYISYHNCAVPIQNLSGHRTWMTRNSQHVLAVWREPSMSIHRIIWYCRICQRRTKAGARLNGYKGSKSSYFTLTRRHSFAIRVKNLAVHHHSAGYILFPLGLLSPSWLFWKSNTALAGAGGRMQPRKLQCCIWRNSIKPSFQFLWFCVFFFQRQ